MNEEVLTRHIMKVKEILYKRFSSAGVIYSVTSLFQRDLKIFHNDSDICIHLYLHPYSTMRYEGELVGRNFRTLRSFYIDALSSAEKIATRLQKEAIQAYE